MTANRLILRGRWLRGSVGFGVASRSEKYKADEKEWQILILVEAGWWVYEGIYYAYIWKFP